MSLADLLDYSGSPVSKIPLVKLISCPLNSCALTKTSPNSALLSISQRGSFYIGQLINIRCSRKPSCPVAHLHFLIDEVGVTPTFAR